jgi:hypothetical protein
MTVATSSVRTSRGLSAPLLVGGAFVLSAIASDLFQLSDILFTNKDPHRSEGPIASIISVSIVAVIALAIALAIAVPTVKTPSRAKIGAIVLGALSLVTVPFFWSGAPAIFGAAAAWVAGLTKGAKPASGAARGFGIVGFVVAVLTVVAIFVGCIGTIFR